VGIAIAALVGAVLLALTFVFLGRIRAASVRRGRADASRREPQAAGSVRPGACPLCSTALGAGERIKSDIYPGKGDRIMRIFGCPHCLPSPQRATAALPRVCPVCLRELPSDGWLVARFFERPGRRHVHVLGCTACRHPDDKAGRNT
jgi:hypothetical protein